jgi:uncharacterized protein (TIGR03437 family)
LVIACQSPANAQPLAGSIKTYTLSLPRGPSAVDVAGNIYSTTSVMPPATTTPGAAQTQPGGGTCSLIVPPAGYPAPCYQAYIAKSDGSGNTVFATYLGGASNSNGEAIAVDTLGNIYVAGTTGSSFPTTAHAAIPASNSNATFAAKLSADGSKFLYVTLLPSSMATVNGIAVDAQGNAYIAGATSTDYGIAMHASVVKLSADGSTVVYTKVLAGSDQDSASSVAADAAGNAYVTGLTSSPDFPVTAGVVQAQLAGVQNAFVTKLDPSGNIAFSTYLGGSGKDSGAAVEVDGSGNVYVAGPTTSLNFPTTAGSVEPIALIPAWSTTPQGFVAKVTPRGNGLGYSTYFASPIMLALGSSGDLYIAGGDGPDDLPVTPSAPLPCVPGSYDLAGGPFVAHLDGNGTVLDATNLNLFGLLGFGVTDSGLPIIVAAEGVAQITFGGPGWTAGPCMTLSALSAATLSPTWMVPGEFLTFLGVGIGPETGVSAGASAQGTPTSLGGVQVLFDGTPGPVLYAQSGQVNAQAPFELSGQTSTTITLTYGGNTFGPVTVPFQFAQPALFRLQVGITAQAVAENQDGSLNGPSNPAAPGSIVTLWGTGFPPLESPCATGGLNADGPVDLAAGYSVNMVGGGTVAYAGGAPTLACGVVQINMQIPAGAASGPLLLTPQVCTNGGLTCTSQETGSIVYVK